MIYCFWVLCIRCVIGQVRKVVFFLVERCSVSVCCRMVSLLCLWLVSFWMVICLVCQWCGWVFFWLLLRLLLLVLSSGRVSRIFMLFCIMFDILWIGGKIFVSLVLISVLLVKCMISWVVLSWERVSVFVLNFVCNIFYGWVSVMWEIVLVMYVFQWVCC